MRSVIAVSQDPARRVLLPAQWEIWPTTTRIGVTYANLAKTAWEQEWDTSSVVVQDDVRGEFPIAGGFTVYGTRRPGGHICPKAFAADHETWGILFNAWFDQPRSLCPAFTRIANERAIILDTAHAD